ncbi:MAG: phospho-sugar mutase, partial [Acidimicrobiia bacterium]
GRHGSAEMAADTAAVLAGAGLQVQVFERPVPTPVLAFAVRHLGAAAGVVITASHNPPSDNGYKLYLADGAQIVAPVDGEVAAAIDAVGPVADIPLSGDGVAASGDEVPDAYLAGVVGLLRPGGPRDVRLVHTALHGVGTATVQAAFDRAGFPAPVVVPAQAEPDPDFPTVAFPNPEEPGALDLALALARAEGADAVLANDPDADRLAVAVPDPSAVGGWRQLTGDEVGALLADHLLRRRAAAGPDGSTPGDTLVTTVVSSRLLAAQAAAAGVRYAESLTGFKWVVRAPGEGHSLLFGYEEALGYCVGGLVRDKDGIGAALVAAELLAELKAAGSSVPERLDELAVRFGLHVTGQRSVRVEGADWLARVEQVMAGLRAAPPAELAGRTVRAFVDLSAGGALPPADVVVLELAGGRVVVRPSGTEPKLKAYAEVVVPVPRAAELPAARAHAAVELDHLLTATRALLGL